jgi:hypothetical protein
MSMRAVLLRKYKIYGWEAEEGRKLESGIRDTTMLFVRNATPGKNPYIFVILVSEPPWKFVEREIYEFTGVFMKRFPYKRKDNLWETHPLLVTKDLRPAEVTRKDSWHVTVAIVVVAVLAMIVLYFAVRGETRESEEKRKERIERRRANRGLLKQRIESERMRKVDASPDEESADSSDDAGSSPGGQ